MLYAKIVFIKNKELSIISGHVGDKITRESLLRNSHQIVEIQLDGDELVHAEQRLPENMKLPNFSPVKTYIGEAAQIICANW
jgi:hypothetical protein